MANPKVVIRQRDLKWFQEEGELSAQEYTTQLKEEARAKAQPAQKPLKEKYDTGRFQPGWNGKDAPAIEKMGSGYAKGGEGFDDLGASSGKKTSKGSVGKVTVDDIKEAQRILALAKWQKNLTEELLDDEFEDDMAPEENGPGPDEADGFGDEGLADEGDVPPEMGDEGFEGEDGGIADDVTVEIGGQKFILTPAPEDDMGAEGGFGDEGLDAGGADAGFDGGDDFGGDEGGDDFGADEGGDDEELIRHGGVKAESKDITREQRGKKVAEMKKKDKYDEFLDRAIQEARQAPKKITRAQLVAHHLKIKGMLEKNHRIAVRKLKELFTGEYVLNKQGEPGYDFSPVGGDEKFAVIARASTGDQYTPTISKSVYEPSKKGGKTSHATTVTESDFKKWLDTMQKNLSESESDPGEDSEAFNKKDTITNNLPGAGADDYAKVPELIGKDQDTISQYGEAKARVQARRQRESEQPIKFPSTEVKEDLENNLQESFSFKDLVAGKY